MTEQPPSQKTEQPSKVADQPPKPSRADGNRYVNPQQILISLLAVVLALVAGAVLIVVSDPDVTSKYAYFFGRPMDALGASWSAVWDAYQALFLGAFGSWSAISETIVQSTPLICAGLGVALAFRAGLFNIGAQGQIIAGALLAGWVGFGWHLPWGLHLLVATLAGILGGALYGGIVGLLKARTGAHEVIVTIMLNYIALLGLGWLLTTELLQRPGRDDPISPVVDPNATYPRIGDIVRIESLANLRANAGFIVALVAVVVVWWILNRSTLGFRLRAVGAGSDAARTAGMSIGKAYFLAMMLAGALAGLAGAQQVLGTQLPLTDGIAATFGFDAITVALLGRGTPVGTLAAGLLFGGLTAGGTQMQIATGTPLTLTTVLQAMIVLFVAAPALVRAVFRIRKADGSGGMLAKGWNG